MDVWEILIFLFQLSTMLANLFCMFSMLSYVREGLRMRRWESTTAVIDEVNYTFIRSASMIRKTLTARYNYEFGGVRYEGTRVTGMMFCPQNRKLLDHLNQHLHSGERVAVWVEPSAPHNSVLDRRISWIDILVIALHFLATVYVSFSLLQFSFQNIW